jgi:hypothetical protein
VYRILIASPSDVEDEREAAVSVIQQWNDLNSYNRKVALLPLRWETHTAPDYGTRPQEVINRAIVDDCDLLVGIFWHRLGTSTGVAESGTLEEVERVGGAGKPIMLYFSSVGVDPSTIDLDQVDRLNKFKLNTYPKALVEKYKSQLDFREKFTRQLELKIREIQSGDQGGLPLSLQFLAGTNNDLVPAGNSQKYKYKSIRVINFDTVSSDQQKTVKDAVEKVIRYQSFLPIPLIIENFGQSGIRNLYVELDLLPNHDEVEVTQSPEVPFSSWSSSIFIAANAIIGRPKLSRSFQSNETEKSLAKFDPDKLQRIGRDWRLTFEWDALQPQRQRLIKPVLHVYSPKTAQLTIKAKVFADTFPEPFLLEAHLSIEAEPVISDLEMVLPDWKQLIEEDGSNLQHAITTWRNA